MAAASPPRPETEPTTGWRIERDRYPSTDFVLLLGHVAAYAMLRDTVGEAVESGAQMVYHVSDRRTGLIRRPPHSRPDRSTGITGMMSRAKPTHHPFVG